MASFKRCELDDNKLCSNCKECERCDLDSGKFCDSCGKCIESDLADYSEIKIEGVLDDMLEVEEYILTDEEFKKIHRMDSQLKAEKAGDYLFIEDIPELRDKFAANLHENKDKN